MRVVDCKKHLEYKIAGGRKLPSDDLLSELFLEAMLWVCNKCVPNELVRQAESASESGARVYRNVENGLFIRYPEKPNFSDDKRHLMIDEPLTFAVINYVAFLIEKEPIYKIEANEIISEFIANDGKEMGVWLG